MAKIKRRLTELVEVSIGDLRDLVAAADVDFETAPRLELDRLDSMETTIERHENSPAELRIAMQKSDLLWLVDVGAGELPPSVDATHVRIKTADLKALLAAFKLRANAAKIEITHHLALSRCLELRPSPAMQKVDCLVRHEVIGWAKLQAEKQQARALRGKPKTDARRTAPPAAASPADVKGGREGGSE